MSIFEGLKKLFPSKSTKESSEGFEESSEGFEESSEGFEESSEGFEESSEGSEEVPDEKLENIGSIPNSKFTPKQTTFLSDPNAFRIR